MHKLLLLVIPVLLYSCSSKSQQQQQQQQQVANKEYWDVYMAEYEKGTGSVTLNMGLINNVPIKDLPFVLITGVTFNDCNSDGFPSKSEYNNLSQISDDVQALTSTLSKNNLVGTFTYQCERLDYIYLNDTSNIREKLTALYTTKYKGYKYYINIRHDYKWEGYLEFLYPNEEIREDMSNMQIIQQLLASGDDLSKARQVDHWVYFSSSKDRDNYEKSMLNNGFKVEEKKKLDDYDLPYSLQFSRTDFVDPQTINKITRELRTLASKLNGNYDGWETFVIKE
ncbi:DUF695 domain-containing protein [Labilibacter marinus]|uniref:DUF695 domain-containing protein n=1 Tax=Labilibacter marinus TaxID=1477105 RepID=UPI000834E782|nr:DUF695 domain-containing protein [Labilibacter marinus]